MSPVGYGISRFFRRRLQRSGAARTAARCRSSKPSAASSRAWRRFSVVLLDAENTLEATLRLRIEGLLRAEPAPEPIAFDTLVDAATAEVQVKAKRRASRPAVDDV